MLTEKHESQYLKNVFEVQLGVRGPEWFASATMPQGSPFLQGLLSCNVCFESNPLLLFAQSCCSYQGCFL
jgi:hypothetical protein